jgi:hypothetical protein
MFPFITISNREAICHNLTRRGIIGIAAVSGISRIAVHADSCLSKLHLKGLCLRNQMNHIPSNYTVKMVGFFSGFEYETSFYLDFSFL